MYIKNIKLSKFRTINEAILNFRKGFNLITGKNGAGKSSIQLALAYILLNHTMKSIDDYIKWGEDNFNVSTQIDHIIDKFNIEVKRDKKTERSLKINNELYTDSDAVKKLSEHFDPSFCNAALLSYQGENDLIEATPAARREILKKIYNLNFSEQIQKLEEEVLFIKDNKLSEIENKILKLEIKEYVFKDPKELNITKEDYDKLKFDTGILREKIFTIKKQIEENNKKMQERGKIEEEVKINKTELEEILEDKNKKINILSSLKDQLNNDFEIDKRDLEEKINSIVISRICKFDNTLLEQLKKNKETSFLNYSIEKKKLDQIKGGKCPTCGSKFESHDIEKLEEEVKIKENNLKNIDNQLEDQLVLEKKYLESVQNNKELKYQKEILENKLFQENENIKQKKETINLNIKNLENVLKDKEKLENKLRLEIAEKSKVLNEISLITSNLDYPTLSERKLRENEEIMLEYQKIEEYNKICQEENSVLKKEKEENERTLNKLKKEKEELYSDFELYKSGINILKKDLPNYIINSMLVSIENGMNEFLEKTYNGKYTVEIKENKNGIDIFYGPNSAPAILASGAEKYLMNIGLKIAYNKLSGMKILFLDEIDAMMDLEISKEVFKSIYEMYQDGIFEQIFVITHKESIKELIENEYYAKVFEVKDGEFI